MALEFDSLAAGFKIRSPRSQSCAAPRPYKYRCASATGSPVLTGLGAKDDLGVAGSRPALGFSTLSGFGAGAAALVATGSFSSDELSSSASAGGFVLVEAFGASALAGAGFAVSVSGAGVCAAVPLGGFAVPVAAASGALVAAAGGWLAAG